MSSPKSKIPNPDDPNTDDETRPPTRLSGLYDLYVDLLGSLVPGLLTVILGGAAIILTLSTVHVALFQQPLAATHFPGGLAELLANVHWELATVIVVSSYVIGAAFFRQDPKRPDAASALHVWMHSKRSERNGLAVQASVNPLPRALILDHDDDVPSDGQRILSYFFTTKYCHKLGLDTQFPYLHLRCYLAARGLTHLLQYVPWCPKEAATKGFRTKMFINILKVRLLAFFPEMSRDIIRNEAHVRLATSVWYSLTSLLYVSTVLGIVIIGAATLCIPQGKASALFVSSSFIILLILFCVAMRRHLRKCIHYMRVREVIYVLEGLHMACAIGNKTLFAEVFDKGTVCKGMECDHLKSPAQA